MTDFTNCEIEYTKFYDGLNGKKLAIYFEDEIYMLKFPKETHVDDNYASSTINEHISSSIFTILGFNTQKTLLGYYKDKVVVACKDFEGFDKRLINFGKIKNSAVNSVSYSSFVDTDFYETIEIINKQKVVPVEKLKSFYYEMFIADTLIANFDRHNGNWGLLANANREIGIAPIYDCGSSLYPKLKIEDIEQYLNHKGSFNDLMLNRTTSAITVKNKKINPQMFLKSHINADIYNALEKVCSNIDENKIYKLIDDIEIISETRKEFYKIVIKERRKILEKILKQNHNVFNDKNSFSQNTNNLSAKLEQLNQADKDRQKADEAHKNTKEELRKANSKNSNNENLQEKEKLETQARKMRKI